MEEGRAYEGRCHGPGTRRMPGNCNGESSGSAPGELRTTNTFHVSPRKLETSFRGCLLAPAWAAGVFNSVRSSRTVASSSVARRLDSAATASAAATRARSSRISVSRGSGSTSQASVSRAIIRAVGRAAGSCAQQRCMRATTAGGVSGRREASEGRSPSRTRPRIETRSGT